MIIPYTNIIVNLNIRCVIYFNVIIRLTMVCEREVIEQLKREQAERENDKTKSAEQNKDANNST